MDVVHGIDRLDAANGRLFVVVGVFDGLHRGHRYLLTRLAQAAARHGARPAVITFDAHPDEIVVGAAPPLLCDPEERLARLASAGVAVTVVQHFDAALRMTEFDAFVGALRERVDLAGFLMTPDAAFGHERRGTPTALAELAARLGFDVEVVPPFRLDDLPVRSATIRADIATGRLDAARRSLGRSVAVTGTRTGGVVSFPIPVALPPEGRYDAAVEPAWTALGRVDRPRRASVTVADGTVGMGPGTAARTGVRARVTFGRRLPPKAKPAILRRS
jgi:riboflavin kinase / FMN adenylyltransferase